jgi:hypothetical protein
MNPNCFKAIYQGEVVWFILDESFRPQCPPGAIIYTLAEAEVLANRSEWTRKIVHEGKKAAGQLSLPVQPRQPKESPQG